MNADELLEMILKDCIPGHADGILDIWNMNTNEKFVMECQFYKNKSEALLCYIDKKLVLV